MSDIVYANVSHYNKIEASKYDNPSTLAISKVISSKILQFEDNSETSLRHDLPKYDQDRLLLTSDDDLTNVNNFWKKSGMSILDFACGTGLISQHLFPYCKQIVGIDVSQDMVDVYNEKFRKMNIPKERACAYVLSLDDLDGNGDEPFSTEFDAVVCSMAYHHIKDLQEVTNKLSKLLKPNGRLFVADLIKGGDTFHGNLHPDEIAKLGVAHHGGFTPQSILNLFKNASLSNAEVIGKAQANVWVDEAKYQRSTQSKDAKTLDLANGEKLYEVKLQLMVISGIKT
ncbi:hexaprenyldihydroxybenzoate methyltransferase, Coq3 variant [Schizosaccharomyces pombe]|uniref:Uncharacterized methyltransferase C1347.09 n=1 Tax=Schizosaccharomyces pombe (strain 972 / ATCC 24843) TaxID=284812 RepID=YGE9_SCHPO|nr:putative hexaprenyldihydroxybenzoate methyltransferase [Schizosaccharomyces pombe]O94628.1 RecName: Full=Uncharacterized methyltransferase C1347.09 [Schizosaccharomyces pombe 972h-]CAB37440.1 hexaprenyldihydroxybenzoate methyltransferase (predicted) [Schizosaccharomyces pombe]|eukprot:NP_596701.1 putative hexaprenyldihydroxybenzoate methyltransferase [Schizosaccharomyces pombe]